MSHFRHLGTVISPTGTTSLTGDCGEYSVLPTMYSTKSAIVIYYFDEFRLHNDALLIVMSI